MQEKVTHSRGNVDPWALKHAPVVERKQSNAIRLLIGPGAYTKAPSAYVAKQGQILILFVLDTRRKGSSWY